MLPGIKDGPSQSLLNFMAEARLENEGNVPAKWAGYRELTEK